MATLDSVFLHNDSCFHAVQPIMGFLHRLLLACQEQRKTKVVAQTPEMAQTPERPPAKRPLPCPMDST